MVFPIHFDMVRIRLPIVCFKGSQVKVTKLCCISISEHCLNIANSADPDKMQHYAAFHMGLHCLPQYPFRGFQYTRVNYQVDRSV